MVKLSSLAFAGLLSSIALGTTQSVGAADEGAPASDKSADLRALIAHKIPGVKAEDIHTSPVNGLFEVSLGSSVGYVTSDGKYLITGDMYELETRTNMTETRRTAARSKALAGLKEDQLIVFSPPHPKHTVTVFTDMDCGYCRQLHSEIEQYNKLGISVRYAAFPRTGPGSASWKKAEAVWCSKDRKDALTRAKLGQAVSAAQCVTPVAAEYQLGNQIGVNGTPSIFTESGEMVGGYVPAAQLSQYLDGGAPAIAGTARKSSN